MDIKRSKLTLKELEEIARGIEKWKGNVVSAFLFRGVTYHTINQGISLVIEREARANSYRYTLWGIEVTEENSKLFSFPYHINKFSDKKQQARLEKLFNDIDAENYRNVTYINTRSERKDTLVA